MTNRIHTVKGAIETDSLGLILLGAKWIMDFITFGNQGNAEFRSIASFA